VRSQHESTALKFGRHSHSAVSCHALQEGPLRDALSAALRQRTATTVADDAGWDYSFDACDEDQWHEGDENEQTGAAGRLVSWRQAGGRGRPACPR
jgi:hypothetical protein